MVRAPMSAQIAAPAAPATINAQTMGEACWMMANTLTAPVNDAAPSWLTTWPSCSETTAPNGMDTSIAGRIDTPAMNQPCWMNSRVWNGRLNVNRTTSAPSANNFPVDSRAPRPGNETAERDVTDRLPDRVAGGARNGSPECGPPGRRATARAGRRAGHRRARQAAAVADAAWVDLPPLPPGSGHRSAGVVRR